MVPLCERIKEASTFEGRQEPWTKDTVYAWKLLNRIGIL